MAGARNGESQMNDRVQTETPSAGEKQVYNPTLNTLTELTDVELQAVSGGINPQPLPPRAHSTSF
jgi:hypothetical protein